MFVILERAVHLNARSSITYGRMFERVIERMNNMNYIYKNDGVEAMHMLRMKRAPFNSLVNTFRFRGLLTDSIHCCIKDQVAMFLHILGHN
jgi:hypothetical protein